MLGKKTEGVVRLLLIRETYDDSGKGPVEAELEIGSTGEGEFGEAGESVEGDLSRLTSGRDDERLRFLEGRYSWSELGESVLLGLRVFLDESASVLSYNLTNVLSVVVVC